MAPRGQMQCVPMIRHIESCMAACCLRQALLRALQHLIQTGAESSLYAYIPLVYTSFRIRMIVSRERAPPRLAVASIVSVSYSVCLWWLVGALQVVNSDSVEVGYSTVELQLKLQYCNF